MKCPFCSHSETQVVETRISEDGDFIRRRRQCGSCEKRFTTYERPDVNFPAIVKKDGRRIEFERAKLLASMNLALRKRPVSTDSVLLDATAIPGYAGTPLIQLSGANAGAGQHRAD